MKKLITEADILNLARRGIKVLSVSDDDIITPSAKDRIRELNITIAKEQKRKSADGRIIETMLGKNVVVGSDHTGFNCKADIIALLNEAKYNVRDMGTFNEDSCDYPDFAEAVAAKVFSGEADFGILIDATGIPSAITANKFPGVRAATCYNEFSARSAREHNNANILVVGAKSLGIETVKSILDVFLKTEFLGERHQRRLDKITHIEEKISKNRF